MQLMIMYFPISCCAEHIVLALASEAACLIKIGSVIESGLYTDIIILAPTV